MRTNMSTNGEGSDCPHYTWGALMCLIGVESVVDISDSGGTDVGPGYDEPVKFENLPIGGKRYNVSLCFGKSKVTVTS